MTPVVLSAVTDFGDLALALPLAGIVLLWLIGVRTKIGAAWWIAALALCGGGTALLKIISSPVRQRRICTAPMAMRA